MRHADESTPARTAARLGYVSEGITVRTVRSAPRERGGLGPLTQNDTRPTRNSSAPSSLAS